MKVYALYFAVIVAGLASGHLSRRLRQPAAATWCIYAAFGAMVALVIWQYSAPEVLLNDFKRAYYPAGEIIRDDPGEFYRGEPLQFVNIPIIAWLFAPFTFWNVNAAGALMTVLGVAAVVASVVALAAYGRLPRERAALLAGVFIISGPLFYSLREGNTTHFILLVLIGVIWCAHIGKYGWAGLLLGVATLIKPPLALIAVPFVVRRRWGLVSSFAMTGLVVTGLSLAIYGIDLHRDWYDYAVRPYSQHPLGAENVQSLDSVLARFFTGEYLDRFVPIESLGTGFRVLRTAIAAAMVLAAAFVIWRGRAAGESAELVDACIALCLAIMLAPTSWAHYYVLLLLPVGLMLAGTLGVPWTRPRLALAVIGVALISPPVHYVAPNYPILDWLVPRVLISHYFFGGLVILTLFLEARWRRPGEPGGEQLAPISDAALSRAERMRTASRTASLD